MDKPYFAQEGQYLSLFINPSGKSLVFRVKSIQNKGNEALHYGPIPYVITDNLSTYDGGSSTPPAAGVIPARSYNSIGKQFTPGSQMQQSIFDTTDMWYTDESYRDHLFHIIQKVTPAFIRMDVEVPTGVVQSRFQRDKLITGIQTTAPPLGFSRGILETIQIPRVHYGYRWGNDTNVPLQTSVDFMYAEYVIEIPHDPYLLFLILTHRLPSIWVTWPITSLTTELQTALLADYGTTGFTVYRADQQKQAEADYASQMANLKI